MNHRDTEGTEKRGEEETEARGRMTFAIFLRDLCVSVVKIINGHR